MLVPHQVRDKLRRASICFGFEIPKVDSRLRGNDMRE
jgi:hypothetical protein